MPLSHMAMFLRFVFYEGKSRLKISKPQEVACNSKSNCHLEEGTNY
jgi:hypothetical protein